MPAGGKLLLRFGKRAFGPPTAERGRELDALAEKGALEQLERLQDRFATAKSWTDLMHAAGAAPHTPPPPPDYLVPFDFDPTPMPPSIDQFMETTMHSEEKVIVHMRFQRLYQEDLGEVLYKASLQLQAKYQRQVITAVFMLWRGADGPGVTGEYQSGGHVFRYQVARLWEKDVDEMLLNPLMAVFAPLARFPPERLPKSSVACRRFLRRIRTRTPLATFGACCTSLWG